LKAFAVKHVVKKQGPLISVLKAVREQPYSFTSKQREARASLGCKIYVIEVLVELRQTVYRLGYCYRAHDFIEGAGGTLWKGRFKFKNIAKPGVRPEGVYFERPVIINDPSFIAWYKTKTYGMCEIPQNYVVTLDRLISNSQNDAHPF
jgi:hypothetical protein